MALGNRPHSSLSPPIPATQMATTSTKKRQETGRRLREERERLGYTPQQIAQLLGVPIDVYARFESGEADPGIYRMPRLYACGLTFSTSLPTNGISSWKKKTNFCFVFANFHSAAVPLSLRHSMHWSDSLRTSDENLESDSAESPTLLLPNGFGIV